MPRGCRHLTCGERCRTCAPRKSGRSNGAIAAQLGRSPSSISREIRRNGGGRGYRHRQAQGKASASPVPRKMTPEQWRMAEDRPEEGWGPEEIAGHPSAGLASSGDRGVAPVRRDFSRLGPRSPAPRDLISPSPGRLPRPGCALAAEMAGVALRSGAREGIQRVRRTRRSPRRPQSDRQRIFSTAVPSLSSFSSVIGWPTSISPQDGRPAGSVSAARPRRLTIRVFRSASRLART